MGYCLKANRRGREGRGGGEKIVGFLSVGGAGSLGGVASLYFAWFAISILCFFRASLRKKIIVQ